MARMFRLLYVYIIYGLLNTGARHIQILRNKFHHPARLSNIKMAGTEDVLTVSSVEVQLTVTNSPSQVEPSETQELFEKFMARYRS